jgi:glycosyltransferase involved in cell wall biosynthesis
VKQDASPRNLRRICILTPGHLATDPRVVKEADALVDAGYAVSVIAADFTLWAREADRSFADRSWHIAHTLSFGPHAPLHSRLVQFARQRLAQGMILAGVRGPQTVLAAWHPLGPDLVRAAIDVRADLYIAHYPAALPAAAMAAERHGSRYAFDAEDFHLGDEPEGPAHETQRDMVRAIESCFLPGCAYVTAASPGIADAYVAAYGIDRPTVVLNVFPKDQAPRAPTPRGTADPGPSVYWFSQTIGPDRGLECAMHAIGRARSRPHLYLRGRPAAGFLDRLRKIAAENDVADRLHILPPAAPVEMVRLAGHYDLGFSGEPGHTANNKIAVGNKIFTYLLAGAPTVMSDVPAHRNIAAVTGEASRLYASESSTALADELDALLGDPDKLASARKAAWQLGQGHFNWDVEQGKLLKLIVAALGSPRGTDSYQSHFA